jgi:lipoprotein-anchoring transpeptidase ErfK/SrfK
MRRRVAVPLGVLALVVATLGAPTSPAFGATALGVRAQVAPALTAQMPVVRLTFTRAVTAARLPALVTRPRVATLWRQIGPRDVEAVVAGRVAPGVAYVVAVPTSATCARRCAFTGVRQVRTAAPSDLALLDQVLAALHYLPLTFTANDPTADLTALTPGLFTWAYPALPARLRALWSAGSDNVVLRGALMAFQSDHALAPTGVVDAATWRALDAAIAAGAHDPHPYAYVDVTEASPESLTLYVSGRVRYRARVNTGISISPTQLGTYPVYLRYRTQVMRGTNPDGTTYADPVAWVSYFYGGDALHQFYRANYGWPQSLGCVEMTASDAQTVWPYTPIGTLVTVRAA